MKIINIFLTLFNVSLYKFKVHDVVFLNKRGIIGWEEHDTTIFLSKNRLYSISYVDNLKSCVCIDGYMHSFHPKHFIKVDKDEVAGLNIFKIGDNVILDKKGTIGWENVDTIYGLDETRVYKITNYVISGNHVFVNIDESLYYSWLGIHPNHFKKVK